MGRIMRGTRRLAEQSGKGERGKTLIRVAYRHVRLPTFSCFEEFKGYNPREEALGSNFPKISRASRLVILKTTRQTIYEEMKKIQKGLKRD